VCISDTSSFSAFLSSELVIRNGERAVGPEYYFSNPVQYWNSMNWNLLSSTLYQVTRIHIRYEDMLKEPARTSEEIARRFNMRKKSEELVIPSGRLKNLPHRQHDVTTFETNTQFDKEAVYREAYLEYFTSDVLELFNKNINVVLMKKLGYRSESANCE